MCTPTAARCVRALTWLQKENCSGLDRGLRQRCPTPSSRAPTISGRAQTCAEETETTMAIDRLTPQSVVKNQTRIRVVVATTVMLSFISFWRAAAIVLNDLGSSAYYVGG